MIRKAALLFGGKFYADFEEIKRKMAIVFLFHKMRKIHVLHVFYRNDG